MRSIGISEQFAQLVGPPRVELARSLQLGHRGRKNTGDKVALEASRGHGLCMQGPYHRTTIGRPTRLGILLSLVVHMVGVI